VFLDPTRVLVQSKIVPKRFWRSATVKRRRWKTSLLWSERLGAPSCSESKARWSGSIVRSYTQGPSTWLIRRKSGSPRTGERFAVRKSWWLRAKFRVLLSDRSCTNNNAAVSISSSYADEIPRGVETRSSILTSGFLLCADSFFKTGVQWQV